MPKVLISDKMDDLARATFEKRGIEVDVITGLSPEELKEKISDYDGLAVRSSTKVTPEILAAAKNLKVIGRAGIGVDNIDVPSATAKGVIVMNTPFGNSITTAEHAISLMFSLARHIPQANASTQAGKWEKSKFMGVELYGKTLGLIGCGNIGAIVANRAVGLQMRVCAFDPFLTEERAKELGVEHVTLDELYAQADFITIHVPKNEKTLGMVNAAAFAKMKNGVRIINCARGGLIVEADLKQALDSGKVAGAALDVFEVEPATENALFGHENLICTPHLGASTQEAQVNVALQVAEQLSDYLLSGAITNALNTASISAEEAPKLKPYLKLCEQLGSFSGQITGSGISKIEIAYAGKVAKLNTRPLTATILAKLLGVMSESVNMVNAFEMAKSKGITISETKTEEAHDNLATAICVTVTSENRARTITGTLYGAQQPRIIEIEGVPVEAALSGHMLFIRNKDKPGMIGGVGTLLAEDKINISDFRLGRTPKGDAAIALVSIDSDVPAALFEKLTALPQIDDLVKLYF